MVEVKLTREEVAKNNSEDSLWCIGAWVTAGLSLQSLTPAGFLVDHRVYDLTDFVDAHPGGSVVLAQVAGQDATTAFYNLHRHEVLQKYDDLCIGVLEGEKPEVIEPQPGDLSQVPYGEPLWLVPQFKSPYYNDSHRRLQKAMRLFTDKYITPEAQEKEKDGTYISQELIDRQAKEHILAMRLGPGKHLRGLTLPGNVKGEEFDYFHDLIVAQEMVRANARGFQDGNMAGMVISLTAVRQWCNDEALRERVTEDCLSGKKKICLAITEAFAGSDVAGIRTTAEKTADGKHYIINGTKKWITNGMFCDYFVVGCKTQKGFSVILVSRDENVETKPIKTSYSAAAGTAYIQFEKVKVPVQNLLGAEDKGFVVIMSNFNHERWMMACAVIRQARSVVEECLKWSNQRIVFGKNLVSQPVIRQKWVSYTQVCFARLTDDICDRLAKMISHVEANQGVSSSVIPPLRDCTDTRLQPGSKSSRTK